MQKLMLSVVVVLPLLLGCKKQVHDGNENDEKSVRTTTDAPVEALTLYCGRGEKLIGAALDAYEMSSGVTLKIKYGDTATLAAALMEEKDRSPADLFIAQDASTLGFLEANGLFDALPKELTAKSADGMKSAKDAWIGLSGRARVLAYSTKMKPEELPQSADALTDAKWKNRVGWAPENASFQSFVAAMVALRGKNETKKWLLAMKKNSPKDYPKNTPAVMAVSRGEIDVALVNHYYLYRLKAEHGDAFPVANHYFKSKGADSLINLSGAGILKNSKNKAAATELLAFLLSDEGQEQVIAKNHEFPVSKGVKSPLGLPMVSELAAPNIDPSALNRLEETVELLRETAILR